MYVYTSIICVLGDEYVVVHVVVDVLLTLARVGGGLHYLVGLCVCVCVCVCEW